MDIGILITSISQNNSAPEQPDFSVTLTGHVLNPTYGQSAQSGTALTVSVSGFDGDTPALSYQWRTVQSGDIPGATASSYLPDADTYDLQTLYCVVTPAGLSPRTSQSLVIRHAPPALVLPLDDEIFDLDTGVQAIPLTGVFAGNALQYSVSGGTADYDAPSTSLLVQTDTPTAGDLVTVSATNSGGTTSDTLTLIVEAAGTGDIQATVDPLTGAGENGIAVSASTILSGDPSGHWQITGGELSPSPAGDAADLDQGPYSLGLGDGATVDIDITPLPFAATQWAVTAPRDDGFDIVIFEVPDDRGTPISALETRINGSSWTVLSATQPGTYPITGLSSETGYRVELRAVGSGNGQARIKGIATVPVDPRGFRGWVPDINLGTGGDLFVAPFGSDTNTGTETAPFSSLTQALSVATSGQTIKLRAGTYRERVSAKAGVAIEGYGREKPRITASEVLEGLAACTPADIDILGADLAINGSPVFKTTLPKSALDFTDILALNLHEAGQRLFIATDRADTNDLFARADQNTFHTADTFTVNGSNRIIGVTHSAVIGEYTDTQLLGGKVMAYGAPNISYLLDVTAANSAGGSVSVNGDDRSASWQSSNPATWLYALLNLGPALTPGTYCVRDAGSNIEVYVYPLDPGNLELIEYSARERIIDFPGSGDDINLHGLHLSQASGENSGGGLHIYKGGSSATTSGHRISHILSTGADNMRDVARSMRFVRVDDTFVENCTYHDIIGRGVFFSSAGGARGIGNKVSRCHFERISGAGFYAYDQERHVEAHNLAKDTGLDAHSNKSNHYAVGARSHQLLFWGNEFENARGYVVWQNHSAPTAAFNWLPIKSDGPPWNRTLTDDNQVFANIPVNDTEGYIFNNSILPNPFQPSTGNGIDLARSSSDIIYTINNNITHGMNDLNDFQVLADNSSNHTAIPTSIRSNIITSLNGGQGASDFDISNAVSLILPTVYTDAAAFDFSPAAGSPILTVPGQNMSTAIATLAGIYTQFSDFDLDFKSQTIDWAQLPVGADAGLEWVRSDTPSGFVSAATAINSTAYQGGPNHVYTGTDYTPASDANVLVIGVAGGAFNAAPVVQWRGVTLTPADSLLSTPSYVDFAAIYVVTNPGSTAGTLTVQQNGADDTNSCMAQIMEFSGVTGTVVQSVQSSSTDLSPAASPTTLSLPGTTAANVVVAFFALDGATTGLAAGGNSTLALQSATGVSASSDVECMSQYHLISGSGAVDMGAAFNAGTTRCYTAFALELAAG